MLLKVFVLEVCMSSLFNAHGHSAISIADNIMTIQSRGPWNIEYFEGLHRNIIEVIKEYSLTDFAVLLIPYGEAIGVHEAMKYHVEFLRQGSSMAVAVNLSNCETPLSTESMCRVAYESADLAHEFFSDNESAISWLKTKLI